MLYKTFIAFCLLLVWITLAVAPAFAFEDTDCQFCTSNHCPVKKAQTPSCHHKTTSESSFKSTSCPCKHQAPLFTYEGIVPLFESDTREVVTNVPEIFSITRALIDLQADTPPPKNIVS